jgi:hypothetical protein
MATSRRWKSLKREVDTLRRQFLPDPFDPLGVYAKPTLVQAQTRAFLVLSHAELESYLEDWAKEIVRAADVAWNGSNRISKPLAFLLSTLGERMDPQSKDSPKKLADTSSKVLQKFYRLIKDNHGVKEVNVLTLFAPLGIPATTFGPTLLAGLDTLGTMRGTHAHQSAKAVVSVLDPETEYKRVTGLISDLLVADRWLVGYRRTVR